MNRIIRCLADIYQKVRVKPFKGILQKLYFEWKIFFKNKVVIAERDGIKWELHLGQMIDSKIYYKGCFEPITTAVINKFVKRGMTVLDIGANIGCHTLRLAKLVGSNGKVIAFEPMTWAFRKLKRNLELNNFNNVHLERMALSNENKGNQIVRFYASWPLDASLHNDDKIHPIHHGEIMEDEVRVTTLDDYIRGKGINKIDFIKLDVDGYEYKVIRGGVDSIKKFKPIMIIEFSKYALKEHGDSLENLIDLLVSLGYSFYSEKDLKRYPSGGIVIKSVPDKAAINVLCKPELDSELGNSEVKI